MFDRDGDLSTSKFQIPTTDADPAPDRSGVVLGMSTAGHHRISYVEWGPVDDPRPVVCVHGLTRQGRDFDFLARDLAAKGRRVVCPDLAGRGRSDRLAKPELYALPQYCADMNALFARLDVESLDWVGTSLGGLIGIVIAGMPGSAIRRLVVNDIGPYVSSAGLARISRYVQTMPESFPDFDAAVAYFKSVLAPYGDLSEDHWRHIARHSTQWSEERGVHIMLCDRKVGKLLANPWISSLDLWNYWEAIAVPTLVLHGAKSDLLAPQLTQDMIYRNRNAAIARFSDCGHVPPLVERNQIDIVSRFLTK